MKKILLFTMISLLVVLPASLMAMSHEKHGDDHSSHQEMDHSKMGHGTMNHGSKDQMKHDGMDHSKMDHGGMEMHGDMAQLGTEVVDGVKASARIKNISAAAGKMGMKQTHHLMVDFTNSKNGAALARGTVAVKVKGPNDREGKPVKLMSMGSGFGADLELKEKGKYHFKVGTKLEDGTKRKFMFHTTVE